MTTQRPGRTSGNGSVGAWWRTHALPTFGVPLSFLKRYWILAIITLIAALIAGVNESGYLADENGNDPKWMSGATLAALFVIALAALADKVADAFDSNTQQEGLAAVEDSVENSVDALRDFINKCAKITTMSPKAKKGYVEDSLREFMVTAAVQGFDCGARASYYTLSGAGSRRVLGDPVHGLANGRTDQPFRPFIEEESPDNTIWEILERADTEPEIVTCPDSRLFPDEGVAHVARRAGASVAG